MNKKIQQNSKLSVKAVQNFFKELSSDYYFDMYEPNYHEIKGNYTIKNKIENTKEIFCKYHPKFNLEDFNKLSNSYLEDIVENDTTIYFDEKYIYLELYKILFLIQQTMELREYIKTSKYKKYLKDNKNLTKQKNNHKSNILPSSNLYDKGEHRLNYHYLNNLQKENKTTKFFLQIIVLTDIEKVAILYKGKRENIIKTINFLENRLVQKTTQPAILKSLGILLHHEFKNYLKIKDTKSKELIVDIMSSIFDVKVNDDEFNRCVYITSTVSYIPIFGASKNKYYLEREKKLIRDILLKDFNQNKQYKLNKKVLEQALDTHLKSQHLEYLKKYPIELLKIKEKYSHLEASN